MLLPPELKSQVQKNLRVLKIDLVGYILDAFIDAVQGFGPVPMVMPLRVATRALTIGVKDGGQVDLYVSQVVPLDELVDAFRRPITVGRREAHNGVVGPGEVCGFRVSIQIPDDPLRMFPNHGAVRAHHHEWFPEAQTHAFGLESGADAVKSLGEFLGIDFVFAIVLTPASVESEDVEAQLGCDWN